MEFLVRMRVDLPSDLDPELVATLLEQERDYSHQWQRTGKWTGLWRIVGEWANYSVFDVEDNDELHQILSGLPLFPYLEISVTPLTAHPSWLGESDPETTG